MRVDYLAVCRANFPLQEALLDALREAHNRIGDVDEDTLGFEIELGYSRPCDGNEERREQDRIWLRTFRIAPDLAEEEEEQFLKDFHLALDEELDLVHVVKLFDSHLERVRAEYGRQIFEVEMKLREALTFIFASSYGKNFYGLLDEAAVKWPGNKPPDEETMRKGLENQLFYLSFSDYIDINAFKALGFDQFRAKFLEFESFEDLKRRMTGRPIERERHIAFLASLKPLMNAIDQVRNCVAHNRAVPDEVSDNYAKSRADLMRTIEEFLQSEAVEPDQTAPE